MYYDHNNNMVTHTRRWYECASSRGQGRDESFILCVFFDSSTNDIVKINNNTEKFNENKNDIYSVFEV